MLVGLFVSAIIIKQNFNKLWSGEDIKVPVADQTTYKELEDKMQNSAKDYVKKYYDNDLLENNNYVVTLKKLQEEKMITDIKDIKSKKKCSGYVIYLKQSNNINYKAYLNCSNYQTNGYIERYDNIEM